MDFSRVCRTCLGTESLKSIFAQTVDHRRQSTVIFITAGVKVELDDGLPQKMCMSCISFLNDCLMFRKRCKDSESTLLKTTCVQESPYNVEDFPNDILKIELKCEFETLQNQINSQTVKSENDSNVEHDVPIGHIIQRDSQKEGNFLSETEKTREPQGEGGLRKNGKPRVKKKNAHRVSCPECRAGVSPRSLRAHLAARHPGVSDQLRCPYCRLQCPSREALVAHSGVCPRRKRASKSAKEMVRCEECSKTMQRASLRAHVAVKHKGLKPVCEHCGRRFGNKLRLIEHLRAKHGHAKLQCAHCDYTSASRLALENHERRHRGEKPFVCETCGAKFHAAYLLVQHRQSHRTERHVKCDQCGACFKSGNGLRAHVAARHGARALRCPLCARPYSCRHYVVKHMRTAHGHQGKVPPLEVDPTPAELP